jgi:hypothetical protein
MDLTQNKLTKAEWNSIEILVSPEELFILDIITKGFHDGEINDNTTLSLLNFLKISPTDQIHKYIYKKYLLPKLEPTFKKYNVDYEKVTISKKDKLKTRDLIRFENTDSLLEGEVLFDFILIELIETMLKAKNKNKQIWIESYYTLVVLNNYSIKLVNPYLKNILNTLLNNISSNDSEYIPYIINNAYNTIEKNTYLLKYADIKLYDHQKQLFQIYNAVTEEDFANKTPRFTLYIAPTSTGKTVSPLGLSESYKVIFVCAARHVGLALARAAISKHKMVAFAFGCNDASDIRLHYFAAKECIRNKRTGQIAKVDNSVGDKVEIMICDIKSYITAMYYMLAFNTKEKIIMYWDEPTISLDYDDHPLHETIKAAWQENKIPNIILSSATLPKEAEIASTIADYHSRFPDGDVRSIISHDSKKTIPLVNKEGMTEMPHYTFTEYEEVQNAADHCLDYLTILRYLDLNEAVKFILHINEKDWLRRQHKMQNYFEDIKDITMKKIKMYYLLLLKHIPEEHWNTIYQEMLQKRTTAYNSTIYVTTRDSHTLTDGPTLFLAEDIHKVAEACIKMSQIPKQVIQNISDTIIQNNIINNKIDEMERELESSMEKGAATVNSRGGGCSADMSRSDRRNKEKGTSANMTQEMRILTDKIQDGRNMIKTIALHDMFIPNRKTHLEKWCSTTRCKFCQNAFSCNISDAIVEEIMMVNDVEDSWKILLLMGIGVFASEHSSRYMEIMKRLADEQKLFIIIASTDYIYGTNYQFCHSYISKDLSTMSQEKCIQALGRVGRNKLQHSYSIRFRDNELIQKLFKNLPVNEKPEVMNMNRLFNT